VAKIAGDFGITGRVGKLLCSPSLLSRFNESGVYRERHPAMHAPGPAGYAAFRILIIYIVESFSRMKWGIDE
jgi:hypothetical protein